MQPDENEARLLATYGIRLVCDLRGARERTAAPNVFWQSTDVELLELDITADIRGTAHLEAMQADPGEAGALQLMRLTYRVLPDACAPHLARLCGHILDGHLPLVVHCTAGKDRTGVLVALLLGALGTPREAILADYLESAARPNQTVIEATRAVMNHALDRPVEEGALRALCGVRAEYLDEAFRAIKEDHGNLDNYLRDAVGLDTGATMRLRDTLLA